MDGRTEKNDNGQNTENAGCWYDSSAKYKSDRVLEMDEELYQVLSAEKTKQDHARAYFGDRFSHYYETAQREITQEPTVKEIKYLCIRADGSYITLRIMQYTSRIIHNDLNIRDFDYHSLHHTHAAVLLERGATAQIYSAASGAQKDRYYRQCISASDR